MQVYGAHLLPAERCLWPHRGLLVGRSVQARVVAIVMLLEVLPEVLDSLVNGIQSTVLSGFLQSALVQEGVFSLERHVLRRVQIRPQL